MDNAKYTTMNKRLIPHALCTEPLGSGAHDEKSLLRIPFFLVVSSEDTMPSRTPPMLFVPTFS